LHHSFDSLGIPVPANQDYCKARIWPVLSCEKNSHKEILVHSKNQAPSDLSLSIWIVSPPEEGWTQASALEDLTLRFESELEEKVLKYKLALKDRLNLEWSWQEEPGRGGMECTILAHISTGTSAISIQNKWHLHWKGLEAIMVMNNEVEFSAPAHDLLLKSEPSHIDHQAYKHRMASIQASPQVARKKRFIKLDLGSSEPNLKAGKNPFHNT
jgi:hypothetical protein